MRIPEQSCITLLAVLLLLSPTPLLAGDLSIVLDYYHTDSTYLRDRLYGIKMVNDEQIQAIYDDLLIADDSSRRTLGALLEIVEWRQIHQYRNTLTRRNRVFSEEFIVPERTFTQQNVTLTGGELQVGFDVRRKINRRVPVGIQVSYAEAEVISTPAEDFPLGRHILLTDLERQASAATADLALLFIKIESYKEEEEDEEAR